MRQRQGNIYQPHCLLEYGNISGRFWDFSAEWFKTRPGSQIVGNGDGLWKMPYLCQRVRPEMSAAFDCLESFVARWESILPKHCWGEESNYLSLSLGTVPQTVSVSTPPLETRPNLLPSIQPTHPPTRLTPCSLQFAAAHPLSSNPSRLRMTSRSHC